MDKNHGSAAVFIDRDGVIIHNRANYVRSWNDVKVYPYAISALVQLAATPFKIVIITNQSAIGRGLVSRETVEEINQRLTSMITTAGGRVEGIFLCPHTPKDACFCRKPQPGLILQAAKSLDLDLAHSVMIGDALTDMNSAQNAGVGRAILVLTGRGKEQNKLASGLNLTFYQVQPTLAHAVNCLLARKY